MNRLLRGSSTSHSVGKVRDIYRRLVAGKCNPYDIVRLYINISTFIESTIGKYFMSFFQCIDTQQFSSIYVDHQRAMRSTG